MLVWSSVLIVLALVLIVLLGFQLMSRSTVAPPTFI